MIYPQNFEQKIGFDQIRQLLKTKCLSILDKSVYGRVDLHSLRHTYATRCIESGMPAKVLQNLLGHTDIRITLDTYCDVFQKYSMENLAVADSYMKSNNIAIV